MATDVIAPPPGFMLDAAEQPPLPPGFKLDGVQPAAEGSSVLERMGTGIADTVWGAGQLAAHMLPKSVVDSSIVDQMVKDREAEYNAKRAASGSEGMDWARLGGNLANPMNYFLGGGAAKAATLAGRVGLGVAGGAASGAMAPETNTENYWTEKGKQAAIGGAVGAAVPTVAAGLGRVINPQTSAEVKGLVDKGISPTIGQTLGGTAQRIEEKLMGYPIIGDIISSSRAGATDDMNRALYNMALEPIGGKSSKSVGRAGVNEVREQLSNAYSSLLKDKELYILDKEFAHDLSRIRDATIPLMSPDAAKQFQSILKYKILQVRQPNGAIDGEMMKGLDSQLGQMAHKFGSTNDINMQSIGDGLDLVQQALRSALGRNHPELKAPLDKVNEGYRIYAHIRNAASRKGSRKGVINPSTFDEAVRKMSGGIADGGTATGTGFMRQFSDDIQSVLGQPHVDDRTTGRWLASLGLGAAAMYSHPSAAIIGGILASAPYMTRKATTAMLTKRPDFAVPAADFLENAARYATPGIAQDAAQ